MSEPASICTGDVGCTAYRHVHGCYADTPCQHPDEPPAGNMPDDNPERWQ